MDVFVHHCSLIMYSYSQLYLEHSVE